MDAQQRRPGEKCDRPTTAHSTTPCPGVLRIETARDWQGGGVYRTSLRCSACRRDYGPPTNEDYARWRAW